MHGPDGTECTNVCEFVEVVAGERVVFVHVEPVHRFEMAMTFPNEAGGTGRTRFDSVAEADRGRAFVVPANKENLDRLQAE